MIEAFGMVGAFDDLFAFPLAADWHTTIRRPLPRYQYIPIIFSLHALAFQPHAGSFPVMGYPVSRSKIVLSTQQTMS